MSLSGPGKHPLGSCDIPRYARAEEMGVTLRPATEGDLRFLSALYASTRQEELAPLPWSETEKAAFLDMQFRAQHSHYHEHYPDALWLIVEHGDVDIGRLYLEYWPSEHRIIDIALMPDARGKGIGQTLLRDVMKRARAEGKTVGIHVEKANPAMRLYRRLGFETVEDKGVYDLMIWKPDG